MRVLLVNPGHARTFWSFNRVLKIVGKKDVLPPLGLLTVAALLPEGWEPRVADLVARDITEDDWNHGDTVFITGMSVQRSGILETIREAKKRGKTVVVGGPWVFHFPDEAFAGGADIIVKGEGEHAISRLCEALEAKESGIIIEGEGRPDLKDSPVPRYDLLDINLYLDMGLQFSRGCPFKCEFCDITLMFGRKVRTKSAEQILDELALLYRLGWRGAVFFVDDNFIGNPLAAKALLKELVRWQDERGYPFDFYTQASVNLAADPELLDLMARAGFFSVFLGIETTDLESLQHTRKFQNAAADLDKVCRTINEAGLQIIAGCIIGFDNERPGADQRLIDFALRNQIPEMFITLLQAGPGTDLWKRLEKEGRLREFVIDDNFSSQTALLNFAPTRPLAQIAEEFINLYDVLYEPTSYMERAFQHLARMTTPPVKKKFRMPYLFEIRTVLRTLFRQGVLYPSRWEFWKYLLASVTNFPQRLRFFFVYCVKAEHYYEFRSTVKKELRKQLEQLRVEEATELATEVDRAPHEEEWSTTRVLP